MAKDARNIPAGMPAVGGATENQTSPLSMREPSGNEVTHDGPQRGSTDEYLPASYEVKQVVTKADGTEIVHTLIRHDR